MPDSRAVRVHGQDAPITLTACKRLDPRTIAAMAMFLGNDRNRMRRYFCEVWARRSHQESLDALGRLVLTVIAEHPEYQPLLEQADAAVGADFAPESGQVNPFLHLAMHLAIREQLTTDRPMGIAPVHLRLAARVGAHEAEHLMMECLGEALWMAQKEGIAPDERTYLECVQRLAQ